MPVSDLPGYYPTILDGGLGVMPPSLAGLFAIVGTAEKGSLDVQFASNSDDVEDEYGFGSLSMAAYDAFAAGAVQVGLVRSIGDSPATTPVTTPEQKIYGPPIIESNPAGGKATFTTDLLSPHTVPGSTRKFRLRIVAGGALRETDTVDAATYQISTNGGLTWGPVKRFTVTSESPNKAKIDMGNGTYIEFEEYSSDPGASFCSGDEYRWETHEPYSSVEEIIAACEKAAEWKDPNTGYGFEYIYVAVQSAGIRDASDDAALKTAVEALWGGLTTIADTTWNQDGRTVFFLVNVPYMKTDGTQTVPEWLSLLEQFSADNRHVRLSVNAGYAMMLDGRGDLQVSAAGGSATGLLSKSKLHHSIGWVRYMNIPNTISIYPYKPVKFEDDEDLFTPALKDSFANHPIVPWSVTMIIDTTTPITAVDGGDGKLYDQSDGTLIGAIDYETGALTFESGHAPTEACTVDYLYITNKEIGKSNLARLNDARFLSMRQWIGYGIRFTDDWMMAPATSDYFCIRNRRIMDEAVRMVGIANVPYTNSPGITERDMAAYKSDLSRPLEAMKITEEDTDKPIMDYKLTLTPDENIWSNGIVHCKVEIIPTPTKKKLEAVFQLRTKIEE